MKVNKTHKLFLPMVHCVRINIVLWYKMLFRELHITTITVYMAAEIFKAADFNAGERHANDPLVLQMANTMSVSLHTFLYVLVLL